MAFSADAREDFRHVKRSRTGQAIVTGSPALDREPGLDILEGYIGFQLRRAQNASFKAFKRRAGEADLKPGWFAVLTLIGANPGITPILLSRGVGRDKSTLTPVLRGLIDRGLVTRCAVPEDRRSYALSLAPSGEAMLARLAKCAAEHDRRLDTIVGARKREFLGLLRRIADEID